MLKRAEKHADAVVVPTHAIAERLAEMTRLGARVRVIAGAAPAEFRVPTDAVGRRRTLGIPDGCVVCAGDASASTALKAAFDAVVRAGVEVPVVVIDCPEDQMPEVAAAAVAAGLRDGQVHVRGRLGDADRAAVLDAAVAFVAPSRRSAFPWRVVEALRLGVPVVAVASPDHRETVVDGGLVVGETHSADADADVLAEALQRALASTQAADRLGVLAADRGRAFSWHEAADRVWQLHAEL
jgi:glycosyltransferase involved in cell wall biosynthesis